MPAGCGRGHRQPGCLLSAPRVPCTSSTSSNESFLGSGGQVCLPGICGITWTRLSSADTIWWIISCVSVSVAGYRAGMPGGIPCRVGYLRFRELGLRHLHRMVHKELVLLGQVRSHRSLPKHITTDIHAALIDAELCTGQLQRRVQLHPLGRRKTSLCLCHRGWRCPGQVRRFRRWCGRHLQRAAHDIALIRGACAPARRRVGAYIFFGGRWASELAGRVSGRSAAESGRRVCECV